MGLIKRYESEIYGDYKKGWLLYGLYTGLIMSFSVLFRYWLTYPMDTPSTWTDNIILFLCMFVFTYLYRKKLYCGNVFFKEIYILNLGVGVVAGAIYGLFIWYYGTCVDTDLVQRYIDAQEHVYINNWQGTTEDMNKKIEEIIISHKPLSFRKAQRPFLSALNLDFLIFIPFLSVLLMQDA